MSGENTPNIAVCSKCTKNVTAIGCSVCKTPICLPCLDIKVEDIGKDTLKLATKCPECGSELEYL